MKKEIKEVLEFYSNGIFYLEDTDESKSLIDLKPSSDIVKFYIEELENKIKLIEEAIEKPTFVTREAQRLYHKIESILDSGLDYQSKGGKNE